MKTQQKERAGLLRDLLDNLALIMTDAQVMEASNAAANFRDLQIGRASCRERV